LLSVFYFFPLKRSRADKRCVIRMSGLTQAELDALCCCEDSDSEPSSPVGSMLLARKRWLHSRGQAQTEELGATEERASDIGSGGLSQAELDSLAVEEEPTKDLYAGSPVGSALRKVKNRRRFDRPIEEEVIRVSVAQEEKEEASFTPLACPASWGGSVGGISQAELDAMCDEQSPAEAIAMDEVPQPTGRRRRGRASDGLGSPSRPSRAQKLDA